jgi:uncharacterized protein (DUF2236 family)
MAIVTREDHEAALAALAREVTNPREGILGPRSIAWQLGGDLGVFMGGGRAALLQIALPQVAYAIDHHSSTKTDVVGRFQRTFRHVFAMVFGELDDALMSARRVHTIHSRIHGTMPDGRTYHANDADSLRWVHGTLVDTVLTVRERLDGPMPLATKDAFVVEQNRFAQLFGIPRALQPRSFGDHSAYMQRMFGTLEVTPCAREMARFLLGRGERAQPPLGRVAEAVTASLLPSSLADAFGLARSDLSVRAGLAALAPIYRHLPRTLVTIPARAEALRRLRGQPPRRYDAWMERQLFGLSKQVTGHR